MLLLMLLPPLPLLLLLLLLLLPLPPAGATAVACDTHKMLDRAAKFGVEDRDTQTSTKLILRTYEPQYVYRHLSTPE